MKAPHALTVAIAATLFLYVVPGGRLLARPLVLLSTLVHELGHGVAALLTGGSFERLHLFSNASDVAIFRGRPSRLPRAIVAAGGPLGPPAFAAALFWAARTSQSSHIALGVLAGLLVTACVVWVRNLFGFLFVAVLSAGVGALAWYANDREARIACAFLAIQMTLSVFSRADYLFKSRAQTSAGPMPSDTAQISSALFLPYWFWGGFIAIASLAVLGLGMWSFASTMS